MMKLPIEHFVAGAPLKERGDGTLTYTVGVSSSAEQLGQYFDSKMPADYAVFLALVNPDTNLNTLIHAQGDYTTFAGQGRAYTTRAVYELTRETHATPGLDNRLFPVVAALDKMRHYEEREYGQPNVVDVDETLGLEPLSQSETMLHDVLVHAVVNNRQVFIRLSDSDKRHGDELRHDAKFCSLLRAIDALPQGVRGYVSMGYSLEAGLNVSSIFIDHLQIISHHDDLANWGDAGRKGIVIDWRGDEPRADKSVLATDDEQRRLLQVAPLIKTFLGNGRATRNGVMDMMQLIPENVDRLLGNGNNPSENDVKILMALYDSTDDNTYRQTEAAAKLLRWKQAGVRVPIAVADVIARFPSLEGEVLAMLTTRVDQSVNYQQLVMLYRDNSQLKGLLDVIRKKVLSSRTLMDEAARMPAEPLSQLLQDDIVRKAKSFTLREKQDRLSNAYYRLSTAELVPAGWDDYMQTLDFLTTHGQEEQAQHLKPDVDSWSVDTIDVDVYKAVIDTLDKDYQRALNEKLLRRQSPLSPVLLRMVLARLTAEDSDLLMSFPDAQFVAMMEEMLADEESFVHQPTAAALRYRFVRLKVADTPLQQIPAAAWGAADDERHDLISEVVLSLNYNDKTVDRLIADINWVAAHLDKLPEKVKSHFEQAVQRHLKGANTTLLQVAQLAARIDPRIQLRFNVDAVKHSGDSKQLQAAIDRLDQKGHMDLASLIRQRYQRMLERHAVASYDDVIEQLRKHPYPKKAFASHTAESLLDVLEKKPLSMGDFFMLAAQVHSDRIAKNIERAGDADLFVEVMTALRQRHAAEWLLDENNASSIISMLKSRDTVESAILKELMDSLKNGDKAEFKSRFGGYYSEPLIKRLQATMRRHRTVLAACAGVLVLAGIITAMLKLAGVNTPDEPSGTIVEEPVPVWLYVKAHSSRDSVDRIDSCEVSERHLMSILAGWYQEPFIAGVDRFNMEMQFHSPDVIIPWRATGPMTHVSQLWAIDSLYYAYFPEQQLAAAFLDAKIVTEKNETIDVSRTMPLLRLASEKQLNQQVKQVLIADSISFDIPNQDFLIKNAGVRRDLSRSVYGLWLIRQIDDSCARQLTAGTGLFPY